MLRILAYHRVMDSRGLPMADCLGISATPGKFRRQMRHLAKHYRCVSMPEVLEAIERNVPLPRRAVLITFDDAYADFGEIAWPILRQLRLSATVFVPTAYPDHPELVFWWDKLYHAFVHATRPQLAETPLGSLLLSSPGQSSSLRSLVAYVSSLPHDAAMQLVDSVCEQLVETPAHGNGVLSWNQLRQLAKEGVTLGSHTRTHPILTQLPIHRVREEIQGSQHDLQREIGFALPIFCFPNGDHNEIVTAILRQEGIALAFTVLSGENRLESADLLRLRRTSIWPRTSLPIFCFRLLRVGHSVDAWRHRQRGKPMLQTFSSTPASLD